MNPPVLFPARQRAVALVMVLVCLVLLSALIVGFFTSVSTELQAARVATGTISSQQVADSAVQLVTAQIREGTSRSGYTAWASQPGLIRTYGTGSAASADPLAVYKLYSSDNLVVSATQLDPTKGAWRPAKDVPANWPGQPAIFTDLNVPVPVLDPNGPVSAGGQKYSMIYPILDPLAQGTVEGFQLKSPPGYSGPIPPPASYNPATASVDLQHTANPAPMPVKWIYVLRDGTLSAPTGVDGTGQIANWSTSIAYKKPSAANPIVGRMAFWTDDESSKININTAAGDEKLLTGNTPGSFWDTPRVNTNFDVQLANSQVAQFEFQRYPGHPATVGLSTIFPNLTRTQIASLAPRISEGGSLGGTRTFQNVPGVVKPDSDRLYASIHELVFAMPKTNGFPRPENLPGAVNRNSLEQARFFLTAHSRAPEVNLFGRPRISIWPVHEVDSPTTRTTSDSLLAFCSRIGGQRYNFTRGVAGRLTNNSRTLDFNPRNQLLFTYLRNLTDKRVPGFGGPQEGFVSKYVSSPIKALERDQILTEIYDYIRTTNLLDGLLAANGGQTYTQPKKDAAGKRMSGSGQAIPIKIADSKGFGRFATISEAALQFYATELTLVGGQYRASKMRAVLLFETFSPAQGHAGITPDYYHTVKGLNGLKVTLPGSSTPVSLNFPATATNRVCELESMHGRIWSGTEGVAPTFFSDIGSPGKRFPGTDPVKNYPFISQSDIPIDPKLNPVFSFSGGDLELQIDGPGTSPGVRGEKVQVINLRFPSGTNWPLPKGPAPDPAKGDKLKPDSLDYNWRIAGLNKHDIAEGSAYPFQSFARLVDAADTVRSIEASGVCEGDLRLVEGREADTPVTFYLQHRDYASTTLMQAHGLRLGVGYGYPFNGSPRGTTGKLVAAANYGTNTQPDMPVSLSGAGALLFDVSGGRSPGDWDTGMASYLDGPYINKPDEGTTSPPTANGQPSSGAPYFTNTDDFDAKTLFSPNRQIASPVMFGSLSTGVNRVKPWQTLLFRPDGDGKHPGSAAPKDHLLLDLFTMPIVEPYAISEPSSIAGRVNMNYQIAPFDYIRRETAMRAALQPIWTMAIPTGDGQKYKNGAGAALYRTRVDATETLAQFQKRFDADRLFVSASEICDLELVPEGSGLKAEAMASSYWPNKLLTGDNTREMPYNHLYPLLTTKSNTYTVHVLAQTLQKGTRGDPAEWDERKDRVVSEYRGSAIIERYIDPDDPLLPDFATLPVSEEKGNMELYYRSRVIDAKRFTP